MFSAGFKYFIGLTLLSVVALIMSIAVLDQVALAGTALSMLIVASALLTGLLVVTRDGDAQRPQRASTSEVSGQSMWPLVASIGAVFLALGIVTSSVVFFGGVVVLIAGLAEWMVQSWSERASSDASYNSAVRKRLLNPIEFPVLAALGLGVVIFSFSRIMLSVDRSTGALLFIVSGALVIIGGTLFAIKPDMKRSLGAAICVFGALGIVAGGIAGTSFGVREELVKARSEGHFSHPECGPERSKYFDKNATGTLSLRSSVNATIEFVDGQLTARVVGFSKPQKSITVPRSTPTNIIFRNLETDEFRLVADLGEKSNAGTYGGTEKILVCTQMTVAGGEQELTLQIEKPSSTGYSYNLTVAGVEGQRIEVVVP